MSAQADRLEFMETRFYTTITWARFGECLQWDDLTSDR
jgi:hypothetical protein